VGTKEVRNPYFAQELYYGPNNDNGFVKYQHGDAKELDAFKTKF
jgi:hypothetical protein